MNLLSLTWKGFDLRIVCFLVYFGLCVLIVHLVDTQGDSPTWETVRNR